MTGPPVIVADSGPLISLARIQELELLPGLFGRLQVPPAVAREIGAGLVSQPWIQTVVPDLTLLPNPPPLLGAGEREAIALARSLPADLLLMDEKRGRAVALRLGLHVTGLAGVLVRAKGAGLIPRVRPLLERLQAANCYLSDALRASTLRAAGES